MILSAQGNINYIVRVNQNFQELITLLRSVVLHSVIELSEILLRKRMLFEKFFENIRE